MLLDGKVVASEKMERLKSEIKGIIEKYGIEPELKLIQVGNDPASTIYANSKIKRGTKLGINVTLEKFDNITMDKLVDYIKDANASPRINGIMVESPLPTPLNFQEVVDNISFYKDTDGMTSFNQGNLYTKNEMIAPATARAVVDILEYYKIQPGNACIINRSAVVGRPLAMLLLNRDYTVTLCHSKTVDIKRIARENKVLVVAIGKPDYIDESYVTSESTVIDVGINYSGNKISGDVNFDSVSNKAKNITPVPGGVGIVTATDIFENFLNGMKYQIKEKLI
ncbi:bifunctional methylenetetrahydrofolate dehydrogenase/methenyltetrahydrofolate cyclohydrolase FolD [Ferroplasma acidiphilum]|uniref:bifunctional methylenetetrahydrofolate dehydrogenase/methenyltetrahydrofolate cyclohydrolase FolD n=1 Tax=Ferroplasma acidiphilum TaxID=74969 RepID=UPI002814C898|nr:bifunctional methylenetetrahydrofolate dehydrogenase/methenyltetrahydrofolate cyclohydrolase FolD [Ferroplasma acidiphilum]WMT54027.1 MAG: bifunctional methylenetetrahydrofolate dehydrogenase/methenyltetrahydrofolate cyclohydrolase FolD [Ferroplasma acidiphilum]